MHGFIFLEFERFVFTGYGFPAWYRVQEQAGLKGREYSAVMSYPDEELVALLGVAVQETGLELNELLRRFGFFLVPNLLRVYKSYVDPTWKTIDLLEHAEKTMHAAVRKHDSATSPPILEITRVSPREVMIDYRSPRRLSALAIGIIEGIASFFNELDRVQISLFPDVSGQTSRINVRYL